MRGTREGASISWPFHGKSREAPPLVVGRNGTREGLWAGSLKRLFTPSGFRLPAVRAALELFGADGVIVCLPEFLQIAQQFHRERPASLSRY